MFSSPSNLQFYLFLTCRSWIYRGKPLGHGQRRTRSSGQCSHHTAPFSCCDPWIWPDVQSSFWDSWQLTGTANGTSTTEWAKLQHFNLFMYKYLNIVLAFKLVKLLKNPKISENFCNTMASWWIKWAWRILPLLMLPVEKSFDIISKYNRL